MQVAERELRQLARMRRRRFPSSEPKSKSANRAEKDIMKTACAWIPSDGYLADLLLAILRILGLPIRDETVFLLVGYERVKGT
jgi:hypothetical protein